MTQNKVNYKGLVAIAFPRREIYIFIITTVKRLNYCNSVNPRPFYVDIDVSHKCFISVFKETERFQRFIATHITFMCHLNGGAFVGAASFFYRPMLIILRILATMC